MPFHRIPIASKCLIDKLVRRKLVSNIYPESSEYHKTLRSLVSAKPISVYCGFDATAPSLHIGNLATIMSLLHFHQHGHTVVCVIGDATTHVGDPSGHTNDRLKLDKSVIEDNAIAIEQTLRRLFSNHDEHFGRMFRGSNTLPAGNPIIMRNSTWYHNKNVIDFVGDVFRHARVGSLLHKKSISERLNSDKGMNLSEFCYQIFQAYDWLQLRQMFGSCLQLGGSDQAGNIYTGHDIIKKVTGHDDAIGLLVPLITIAGQKLGKSTSSGGLGVWLKDEPKEASKLFDLFDKMPKSYVHKFDNVFSLDSDEDIQARHGSDLNLEQCRRKLAKDVCLLVHGNKHRNKT